LKYLDRGKEHRKPCGGAKNLLIFDALRLKSAYCKHTVSGCLQRGRAACWENI
jgi:hypothetical protein